MVACVELSQAKLPQDRRIDGKNPLPVLLEGADSPHESFFFSYRSHAALRRGDWKIVREKPTNSWQLFNLTTDLAEQNDLAESKPAGVTRLATEFKQRQDSFVE